MSTLPEILGYAVIETNLKGEDPSFCVHGPDPVDTDYAHTHDQWRYLEDNRPGRRFFLCKLVPIEPAEPEGDPEDRLPFDWARTDKKITDGCIADPVWIEIHTASRKTRERLGIAGTMEDARNRPHPYVRADGHPYDKVEHRLEQYCSACGYISALIAHKGVDPLRSKSRRRARAEKAAALAQAEPSCPATIGEPEVFELSCCLPPGHDGGHHAEWDW